jgi:hypothetical protein
MCSRFPTSPSTGPHRRPFPHLALPDACKAVPTSASPRASDARQQRSGNFINNARAIKGNYVNLKSECYYLLSEKINDRGMYVRCNDVNIKKSLSEELEYVLRHNADKDGKLAIMPKDKVKEKLGRSPDISDMLMMRMYFELRNFEFAVR